MHSTAQIKKVNEMAAVINICFNADHTDRISAFQRSLAQQGISDYAARLGYPPHITMVRVDEADPRLLIPAAKGIIAQLHSIRIELNGLALFGGEKPVLWLAPVPNPSLIAAQRQLCSDLEPLSVHEQSRSANWTPHVTVAAGLDQGKAVAAISALLPDFGPIAVTPSRVEVVSFPPTMVVWSGAITSV